MKKILALLLSIVMVACMFAGCNNKEQSPDTKDPTTNVDGTNPSTDESKPEEIDPTLRQKMWEDVFENNKYKMAHDSFKMDAAGVMLTTMLTDGTKAYVGISGEAEGVKMGVGLLVIDENTIYFNQSGTEGEAEVDKWYKLINITSEDGDTDSTIDEAGSDDTFTEALSSITKVEYVESDGDMDKVRVFYTPAVDEEFGDWTVTYDATFEIEYNGAKGNYRYTEQTDAEGVTSSSTTSTESIDDFSWLDWEFDKEALTLTKDGETIKCTLVEDHMAPTADGEVETSSTIEIYVNSKTYEISKMVMTDETGATVSIEYVACDDVTKEVPVPESAEEMEYEEAMMQFVFAIFGLALGGAMGGIG